MSAVGLPYHCYKCNALLGTKIRTGLLVGKTILHPRQRFQCAGCKTVFRNVNLAFSVKDALDEGLASVAETNKPDLLGRQSPIDWDVLRELFDHGLMLVYKDPDGSLRFSAAYPEQPGVSQPAPSTETRASTDNAPSEAFVDPLLAEDAVTVPEEEKPKRKRRESR